MLSRFDIEPRITRLANGIEGMRYIVGSSMFGRRVERTIAFIALVMHLSACGSAKVTSSTQALVTPANSTPGTVYVADFPLQANEIHSQGLGANSDRRGLLAQVFPDSPFMIHTTRQDKAEHLATLMSRSLTDDLTKHGLHIEHLGPGAPRPSSGWLVSGEFVSVDEGNRIRRSLLGFGAGQTDLEVRAYVTDLTNSSGKQPMLDVTTDAKSGKTPGAALGFNPFLAAGGFVFAGSDSDKDVKHTASKLSDEIVQRLLPGQKEP
jgi:hypothetical protein